MKLINLVLLCLCLSWPAAAQPSGRPQPPESTTSQDLKRLTIEELSELDVTSVSRRVERLSQTAAAISVVRQDDIRRTGVMSLAEVMRIADGLDVARADGRNWNVTARGFNIVTANKLLVLMDGRTLYSPLFAGTFWDVQDTVMADVDRIEVIRGPGGSIWGANAMNGVINIITRDASQSHGSAVMIAAGDENQLIASARHGGRIGAGGSYRVYGKFRKIGANVFANGESAEDPLQLGLLGFRYDSNSAHASHWSVQASAYGGTESEIERDDTEVAGGFGQFRWVRRLSPSAQFQVNGYYDNTYRRVPGQFYEDRHTSEVDVQHQTALGRRHQLIAGGQFRVSTARTIGSEFFLFEPERRTNTVGGVFVQDEIALKPQLSLILGSKFESNDYTGLEVQPTGRLRWTAGESQTLWGAVSRAVRLPTRFDTDLRIRIPSGGLFLAGSDGFKAESVVAYEGGYRIRPAAGVALDFAAFVNRYDNLRSQEVTFAAEPNATVLLANMLNAVTSGVEAAATVQLLDRWRVHGSYAYLHKDLSFDPGSRDRSGGADEGNDPGFFVSLRSYLDLPHGLALDGLFRYVDDRPSPVVPSYASLDLRLGWAVRPGWELSLVGQNLLDDSHAEFGAPTVRRSEFERGFYVRSTWRF
jgi:iron complex outermembrane receptor protein